MNIYFPDPEVTVPFESSPFPLSSEFEGKLFSDPHLTDDEIKEFNKKHRGGYSTWSGALLHIAEKSRPDLSYVAMRLTGYNVNPKALCYKVLHQAMCYLYHHPHVPIMYTRNHNSDLDMYVKNGSAEIIPSSSNPSSASNGPIKNDVAYADGDFGRDLLDRRSVTSTVHMYNGTVHDWYCGKQSITADCTNGSEARALHTCIRKVVVHRRFMTSAGVPIGPPTRAYEDNSATISQVLKDRLTPNVKHLDMKILWLHQQKSIGIFYPFPCPTSRQVADFNSKPTGGSSLQQSFLYIVGARFYPPSTSKHYLLLELDKYNIGVHRGTFRKDIT